MVKLRCVSVSLISTPFSPISTSLTRGGRFITATGTRPRSRSDAGSRPKFRPSCLAQFPLLSSAAVIMTSGFGISEISFSVSSGSATCVRFCACPTAFNGTAAARVASAAALSSSVVRTCPGANHPARSLQSGRKIVQSDVNGPVKIIHAKRRNFKGMDPPSGTLGFAGSTLKRKSGRGSRSIMR